MPVLFPKGTTHTHYYHCCRFFLPSCHAPWRKSCNELALTPCSGRANCRTRALRTKAVVPVFKVGWVGGYSCSERTACASCVSGQLACLQVAWHNWLALFKVGWVAGDSLPPRLPIAQLASLPDNRTACLLVGARPQLASLPANN